MVLGKEVKMFVSVLLTNSASLCFSCSRLLGSRCFGPLLSFIIVCGIGGLFILSRLSSIILCNLARFALLAILLCTFLSDSSRICLRLICILSFSLLCGIFHTLVCCRLLISFFSIISLIGRLRCFGGGLRCILRFFRLYGNWRGFGLIRLILLLFWLTFSFWFKLISDSLLF